MKKRGEIEEKYKWDLTKFCKDNAEFYERLAKLEKKIAKYKEYEGKLNTSNKILLDCFKFDEEVSKEFDTLAQYAFLNRCTDNADTEANEMYEKLSSLITKANVLSTYINVEVSKFADKKLRDLQEDKKFKEYQRYFYLVLRGKKHKLSKKEEVLISQMGNFLGSSNENFDKFSDVDLKFGEIEDSKGKKYKLDQSNYSRYVESKDRTLRMNAFKRMNGKYGEYINFLTSNYATDVKETCTFAKLRKHKSALAAKIFNEEASEKTYNMLIKKVREHIDIVEKFYEIKRRALKLDKIAIYDSFASICPNLDLKFTYDEAIELVKKAVAPMGQEYVDLIQRAKDERWIDVYPNENKDSGAFESASYGATPVVLTNFEGNLNSVFTLAHELGHAMHSYYSNKTQPFETASYTIFVAEVASTTNEMLLLRYLLANAKTKKEKIYYYNYFLVNVRSTIFRQTMFSEFEQFAHERYEEGTPLTVRLLCDKYEELNNFYYGKKVQQIDEMKYEWARIPHFYRSFYVYKYATGMICAINISNGLIEDNKNMLKKYINFLSSGCSKDPISLLKSCDCDLESDKLFDDVFEYCNNMLSELDALV